MSPNDVSLRFRFLYWFYFHGARIQFWLSQRIRPAGICALLVTTVASFMCVGQPKDSIFQLFCFSFGLLALALIWTILRRARIALLRITQTHTPQQPTWITPPSISSRSPTQPLRIQPKRRALRKPTQRLRPNHCLLPLALVDFTPPQLFL